MNSKIFPNTHISTANRPRTMYRNLNFLITTVEDLQMLCEIITFTSKIECRFPQLLTAHSKTRLAFQIKNTKDLWST